MEIEVGNIVRTEKNDQLNNIERKKQLTNFFFIAFFLVVVALQSFLSYNKNIPIRVEFATQAMFYFLTIIMMGAASYNLLKTIKSIFGLENHSFKNEVNQVRVALLIFAVCYTVRVIRNTLVVIYWTPCFTVHRDLTTNFVNTLFYLISDWFAIFAMILVHHNNYKERPADERSNSA
jgi:hypothetical protein